MLPLEEGLTPGQVNVGPGSPDRPFSQDHVIGMPLWLHADTAAPPEGPTSTPCDAGKARSEASLAPCPPVTGNMNLSLGVTGHRTRKARLRAGISPPPVQQEGENLATGTPATQDTKQLSREKPQL